MSLSPRYDSASYFQEPLIVPTGFREYDARWIIEPLRDQSDGRVELNYVGAREIGFCLGRFFQDHLHTGRQVVVGHDFRHYSENVKNAVTLGLVQAGMNVIDIGLSVTPGSYFAQHHFDIRNVAMITASHNDNGWTGLKIGSSLSSTFGPDEMAAFKSLVLASTAPDSESTAGSYTYRSGLRQAYIDDLVSSWTERFAGLPRMRVAVETGNGTAGLYLPEIVEKLGFDVARGNVELDWNFPNFNPNPESIPFLRSVEDLVSTSGSGIGLCVDGDGDRLGVVDDRGKLVFADRIGLLVAKHLERTYGAERPIVIDVKSTSLYETELSSPIVWAKTGHSYVKSRVAETKAIAGFERSGHFFFREPLGRGYDDACVAALAVLWVLCSERALDDSVTLSTLLARLPSSHSSPNRQPYVADDVKYEVVEQISAELSDRDEFAGLEVIDRNSLNGIRLTLADKSWILVRASSNSPNLVIIAETFDEDGALLRRMDDELRQVIAKVGATVGAFDLLYDY